MIKVQILTRCSHCDGEAYLPAGEAQSASGERYTRYEPCTACQGSGKGTRWISLQVLLELLVDEAAKDPMSPDWLDLAQRKFESQYADSRDAACI